MSNPFDYFDKIYCVHLPEHKSRWNHMLQEFEKLEIKTRVESLHAEAPPLTLYMSNYPFPAGQFGVCLSHMKALGRGLASGAQSILILEDDLEFAPDVKEHVARALQDLPPDWRLLNLAGHSNDKVMKTISTTVVRVDEFPSAMAYAVSRSAVADLLKVFLDRLGQPFPHACCDRILSDFAKANGGLSVVPDICSTHSPISVIRNGRRSAFLPIVT